MGGFVREEAEGAGYSVLSIMVMCDGEVLRERWYAVEVPKMPAPSIRVFGMVSVDMVVEFLVWLRSRLNVLVFRLRG